MKKTKKTLNWVNDPTSEELENEYSLSGEYSTAHMTKVSNWTNARNCTGKYALKSNTTRSESTLNPKIIKGHEEWITPSLIAPFMAQTNMVDVKGINSDDVEKAKKTSIVLNSQLNSEILNKTRIVEDLVLQMVEEGTGIGEVSWKRSYIKEPIEEYEYEYHKTSDEEYIDMCLDSFKLLKASEDNLLEDGQKVYRDEYNHLTLAAYDKYLEDGCVYEVEVVGTNIKYAEKMKVNSPVVSIVDVRNIYFDPLAEGDWAKARYVFTKYETTLGDLKASGNYSNLREDLALQGTERPDGLTDNHTTDLSRLRFTVKKRIGYWDVHNDGIPILILTEWVGDTIIRMEENPYGSEFPYFTVAYKKIRGSFYGEPLAEMLIDHQRAQGSFKRALMTSIGRSTFGQKVTIKGALDAQNSHKMRLGQDYAVNPVGEIPLNGIVQTMNASSVDPALAGFYQNEKQETDSASGVQTFASEGISAGTIGESGTAGQNLLGVIAKRQLTVINRLKGTISKMCSIIATLNSKYLDDQQIFKMLDSYQTIDRDELLVHVDVEVLVTSEEQDAKDVSQLSFMLQTMGSNLGTEIPKMVLAEIADLQKRPKLSKAIRDYNPEPSETEQLRMDLENKKLQLELAQMEAEIAEINAKTLKLSNESAKIQLEVQEEASGLNHNRAIEVIQAQAKGNALGEVVKNTMTDSIKTK